MQAQLQRRHLLAAQERQLDSVGVRRGGNPRQRGELGVARGNNEFSAAAVGNAALAAEVVEALAARNTKTRLQGTVRIVDPGMDHFTVARARTGAEALGSFENHHVAALCCQGACHCEADDAGTDHHRVHLIH
jgi:hypothetical protein